MNQEEWKEAFVKEIAPIRSNISYQESAVLLQNLIRCKLLKFSDMKENPDRFFLAHRLLLAPGTRGPGFGIRFTVQFNLFAGSILGLGGPEQVAELETYQQNGDLGCFGLTERLAGVNSGLVVMTTATWIPSTNKFDLHSPDERAYKNWISQGLTATKCVVIATLMIGGKNMGPHAFVMDLRHASTGNLVDGVTVGDMGIKTTANDLDNAWIAFDHVMLDETSLLNKFCTIENDTYVQKTQERMRLEVIGQRLLTGRLAIAQAGIAFAVNLYKDTKAYCEKKACWAPVKKGDALPKLYDMPHLNALFVKAELELDRLSAFCARVESRLSECLRTDAIPSADLVECIAAAKIKSVENSIELCHRLKQEVGSYALMDGTGFEHIDFLQCCKFAEGDSRILMQKIARDRMRVYKSEGWLDAAKPIIKGPPAKRKEVKCVYELAMLLSRKDVQPAVAWNQGWEKVYELASTVCERHIEEELADAGIASDPSSKL